MQGRQAGSQDRLPKDGLTDKLQLPFRQLYGQTCTLLQHTSKEWSANLPDGSCCSLLCQSSAALTHFTHEPGSKKVVVQSVICGMLCTKCSNETLLPVLGDSTTMQMVLKVSWCDDGASRNFALNTLLTSDDSAGFRQPCSFALSLQQFVVLTNLIMLATSKHCSRQGPKYSRGWQGQKHATCLKTQTYASNSHTRTGQWNSPLVVVQNCISSDCQ